MKLHEMGNLTALDRLQRWRNPDQNAKIQVSAGAVESVIPASHGTTRRLALVAAGLADATWTLCPKHEWDSAAGVVLVLAGGGIVRSTIRLSHSTTSKPCCRV